MYTRTWEKRYSTNYGQYRGTSYYSVSQSYGYTLDPQDPGKVQAARPAPEAAAGDAEAPEGRR